MDINGYIQRCKKAWERGSQFMRHDIWHIGKPGETIPAGFVIKQLRVGILLAKGLMEETLLLRASALAFTTLLFIVPFLVFMFSFIQTFNLGDHIYGKISGWLDQRIEQVVHVVQGSGEDDQTAAVVPDENAGEPLDLVHDEGDGPDAPGDTGGVAQDETPPSPDDAVAVAAVVGEEPAEGESEANKQVIQELARTIFPNLAPEGSEGDFVDPVAYLVEMAESKTMDIRTLGVTGLMYVLFTVLGLMRNVEWSFNRIWGVTDTRNLFRTLSDYFAITLLLPFVAAGMLGITAALTTNDTLGNFSIVLRGSQVLIISLTFSLLYYVVPNTSVRPRCALIGGLVGGIVWTLTAWGYVTFSVGLAKYTFFFSTLALFPMLLAWIYTSWLILLFGALVSFAYQNEKTFALERLADTASYAYREAVAVRLMVEMARRFQQGESAFSVSELAEAWNVPARLVNEALEILVATKLVTVCSTEPLTYQPSRAAEKIRIRDVVMALREDGDDPSELRDETSYRQLYEQLGWPDETCFNATVADFVGVESDVVSAK